MQKCIVETEALQCQRGSRDRAGEMLWQPELYTETATSNMSCEATATANPLYAGGILFANILGLNFRPDKTDSETMRTSARFQIESLWSVCVAVGEL